MARPNNRKPHLVDATILFIDLMDSVALSNSLTLLEYNDLINDYQETLRQVLEGIRKVLAPGGVARGACGKQQAGELAARLPGRGYHPGRAARYPERRARMNPEVGEAGRNRARSNTR